MTDVDLRPPRNSITGPKGSTRVLRGTLPAELEGSTLQAWIGGSDTDLDSFTGATAVPPVADGDVLTWTFPIPAVSSLLRWAIDGELASVGKIRPSTLGSDSPDEEVTLTLAEHEVTFTLLGGSGISEAEMTEAIEAITPADIGAATTVQGAKADTAVQPAALTSGLAGKENVGVAAGLVAPLTAPLIFGAGHYTTTAALQAAIDAGPPAPKVAILGEQTITGDVDLRGGMWVSAPNQAGPGVLSFAEGATYVNPGPVHASDYLRMVSESSQPVHTTTEPGIGLGFGVYVAGSETAPFFALDSDDGPQVIFLADARLMTRDALAAATGMDVEGDGPAVEVTGTPSPVVIESSSGGNIVSAGALASPDAVVVTEVVPFVIFGDQPDVAGIIRRSYMRPGPLEAGHAHTAKGLIAHDVAALHLNGPVHAQPTTGHGAADPIGWIDVRTLIGSGVDAFFEPARFTDGVMRGLGERPGWSTVLDLTGRKDTTRAVTVGYRDPIAGPGGGTPEGDLCSTKVVISDFSGFGYTAELIDASDEDLHHVKITRADGGGATDLVSEGIGRRLSEGDSFGIELVPGLVRVRVCGEVVFEATDATFDLEDLPQVFVTGTTESLRLPVVPWVTVATVPEPVGQRIPILDAAGALVHLTVVDGVVVVES